MDYAEIIASVKLTMYRLLITDPVVLKMISVLRANGCPAKAIIAWFDHLAGEHRDE